MQTQAAPTSEDRAGALTALGRDREKRLAAYARMCRRGLSDDGEDLLQTAYRRWLTAKNPVVGPEETYNYLMGAIKGQRFNALRHAGVVKEAIGERLEPGPEKEDDPVDDLRARDSSAEAAVLVQQLYDSAADDPELQLLIIYFAQETPRAEIQQEQGWDDQKYEAVRKRRIRAAAKLLREGRV